MPLHCAHKLIARRFAGDIHIRIEREQLEEIAVRLARRWTGTGITHLARAILTLPSAVWQHIFFRNILRKPALGSRDIIDDPMDKRPMRRVRIFPDERAALRA